ncbi:MAG: hypothetical protein ACRDUA_13765 [Micromonosporaceae bacterium]
MPRFFGLIVTIAVGFYVVNNPAQSASLVRTVFSAAGTFVTTLIGG